MLAGDGAAEFQAEGHDFVEGLAGQAGLVGVLGVEADGRVGVAVPRVGDDTDGEPVLLGDPLDAVDEFAEPGAGHAQVVDHRGALDRLQGDQGETPGLEQQVGLGGVLGRYDLSGAGRLAQRAEGGEVGGGVGGVERGEQQGLGVLAAPSGSCR
ncbi:hypothetical protein SHIRM173S_01332 [Streptomyces hirsutus]